MFCILVFIVFLLLFPIFGIFSKKYREFFKKSWSCAFKKMTFKACDVNFGEEIKTKLISKIIFKYPKLGKFLDKTATLWVTIFILINIGSLVYLANGALNLWVYDTCSPTNGESCSLGGEACSVNSDKAPSVFETISRIPDRLKDWKVNEYISPTATYYLTYDNSKQDALEIIDPGCEYCKKLWDNIKSGQIEQRYNLTYLVYPIPENNDYKFRFSYLIASYMEALKIENLPVSGQPLHSTDWLLLDKIFTDYSNKYKTNMQNAINTLYSKEEVVEIIHGYLREFGYSEDQIAYIDSLTNSDQVKTALSEQKSITEDKVKTIKIPTFMYNGNRYDRVIEFK